MLIEYSTSRELLKAICIYCSLLFAFADRYSLADRCLEYVDIRSPSVLSITKGLFFRIIISFSGVFYFRTSKWNVLWFYVNLYFIYFGSVQAPAIWNIHYTMIINILIACSLFSCPNYTAALQWHCVFALQSCYSTYPTGSLRRSEVGLCLNGKWILPWAKFIAIKVWTGLLYAIESHNDLFQRNKTVTNNVLVEKAFCRILKWFILSNGWFRIKITLSIAVEA